MSRNSLTTHYIRSLDWYFRSRLDAEALYLGIECLLFFDSERRSQKMQERGHFPQAVAMTSSLLSLRGEFRARPHAWTCLENALVPGQI